MKKVPYGPIKWSFTHFTEIHFHQKSISLSPQLKKHIHLSNIGAHLPIIEAYFGESAPQPFFMKVNFSKIGLRPFHQSFEWVKMRQALIRDQCCHLHLVVPRLIQMLCYVNSIVKWRCIWPFI